MFDVSTINKRYFEIKIGNLEIEVEPPRVKVLKKIMALSKSREEDAMTDLAAAVEMILSKNKENHKVSDEVIDELDLDQINEILTAYFGWLTKIKKAKN